MGFTQRQAGGKFTRDEADAFIEQLQSELFGDGPPADSTPPSPSRATPRPTARRSTAARRASPAVNLDDVSTEDLAAELQRRGWVVLEP